MKNKLIILLFLLIKLLQPENVTGQSSVDTSTYDDEYSLEAEKTETPSSDGTYDRHFKKDYKEKYKSGAFKYSEKPEKRNFLTRFFEWLFSGKSSGSGFITFWIWMIKILVALALLYGVYIAVTIIMGKKGVWYLTQKSDQKNIDYGKSEQENMPLNYQQLFQESLMNGDLRMAIRYKYLILLQLLTKAQLISFHPEKTNAEYRREIKNSELAEHFAYVSYIYNHVWYGAFDITKHDFDMAVTAFDHTQKLVSHD
jgi:hypothetical protein